MAYQISDSFPNPLPNMEEITRRRALEQQVEDLQLEVKQQQMAYERQLKQTRKKHLTTLLKISRRMIEVTRLSSDVYNLADVLEDRELARWAGQSYNAALDLAESIVHKDLDVAIKDVNPELLERLHHSEGLDNG